MALPNKQIESIIAQLNSFGDDGVAFDDWMFTIANYVRAHGDVGAFKSTARSLWLSNNKKGVEQLVRETLGGLTNEERTIAKHGDLTEPMAEAAFYKLLCKMGLCKGDTLTVHSAEGAIVPLKFDDDRLPSRPKKVKAPKARAKAPKAKVGELKTLTGLDVAPVAATREGRTSVSVPNVAQKPKTLQEAESEAPKKKAKKRAPRKKKNDDS